MHELLTANPSPEVPKTAAAWAARRQVLIDETEEARISRFPGECTEA